VAQIAVPSELLVTEQVAAGSKADDIAFEPAGKRLLKGFEEPVNLLTVSRR
jgi:class 3 adenylate cyclase